jgi:hypothetical protein
LSAQRPIPTASFETVAGWWLQRFEANVAAGERHPRTLEAHRYRLERHLFRAFGLPAREGLAGTFSVRRLRA